MTRAVLLAIALVAIPTGAHSDSKTEVQQHVARAREAHAAGKYDEALKELTLAFALDPQPKLLYAIGQVHVKLGDCESATAFYQRFLATHPARNDAAVARQAIAKCESVKPVKLVAAARPEPEPEPEPAPQPQPQPPPPVRAIELPATKPIEPAPLPPKRAAAGWYTDGIGDALVLGGVAAGVVAGLSYHAALGDRDAADAASGYQRYADLFDRAQRDRELAIGGAIGGAVLVTAGIVRYVVHDRRPAERAVGIELVHGRAMLTYGGSL